MVLIFICLDYRFKMFLLALATETLISCLLHTPNQGPGLQPGHVPQPGIETAIF